MPRTYKASEFVFSMKEKRRVGEKREWKGIVRFLESLLLVLLLFALFVCFETRFRVD